MTVGANATAQPYIAAVNGNALLDQPGEWFSTVECDTISHSSQLDVGAGNVTAKVYAEFTADMKNLRGISRVALPYGCLHTNLAGVDYAADGKSIQLTAASSGSFSISISAPGVGRMRFVYDFETGTGASPNTYESYTAGNDR